MVGKLEELDFKSFSQPAGVPGVPSACQICVVCWGYGGKQDQPSPCSGQQTLRESQSQDCPEMSKPPLEIHGPCDVGAPGASRAAGTERGLLPGGASPPPNCISWPTYMLASALAPCFRELLRARRAPCLPLPGARFGWKYPGPPPTLLASPWDTHLLAPSLLYRLVTWLWEPGLCSQLA